jgi:hypothetical protein
MTRRRRQSLSPTLFPFLAVLVCTLGTLILLLALVAQNTSDAAAQIAEQAAAKAAEQNTTEPSDALTVRQVRQLIEEEAFRLEELVSFREAQTGDLEQRRNQLAHLEDHMRRIRERLQQIGDAMRVAISEQADDAATEQQVAALRERLEDETEVVRKLRDQVQTKKPRFVIVPHQGPNGTDRRPIYLECTSKGVTIWPENISITKWQLENSSDGANPLDDGLRAARYHAMQEYGDSIPPYPMLLVRPDGVDSYYAARAAMTQWDDQFGYELVPRNVELAYPNPDPTMRERIEYAVNQAVQRVMARSVRQNIATRGGYGTSPTGRGTSRYRSTSSRSNQRPAPPPLSVSQMDRQGRQSGFRDHRAAPTPIYAAGAATGFASGSSPISAAEARERLERQMEQAATTGDGLKRSAAGQDPTSVTALQTLGRNPAANSTATASDRLHSSHSGTRQSGASKPTNASPQTAASPTPMARNDPRETQNGDQAPAGPWQPSLQDNAGNRLGDADQGGRPMPGAKSNAASNAASDATGRAMGTPVNPYASREVSQRYRKTPTEDATAPSANEPPQSNPNIAANAASPLVQPRGEDWALPRSISVGRGNEIVRYVRIEVHPDRFVILPSAGRRAIEAVPIEDSRINEATLRLATRVRDRIEGWGAAAPGARWSPRLKVDVQPGGEEQFLQWARLMNGSGLPIERVGGVQANSASESQRR